MTCDCKVCERHREFEGHIKLLKEAGLDSSVEFFENLYEDLNYVEMDNNVNQAILDGTWPSARQYAEQIIERLEKNG